MLDVAIIGGGPVGSRAAYQLAKSGYSVAIFEKRHGIGEKVCCTGIISQECLKKFNIPSDVVLKHVNSAKLFSPSGEFLRIQCPDPIACIVDRSVLDLSLAEKAQKQGVDYQLNSKVNNITPIKNGVLVDVERRGKRYSWEAKAALLTTGFHASLVKRLGFDQPEDFVTGVQAEVKADGIEEIEVYFDQKLAKGFFAWLAPTTSGKCLAGLMARKSPGYYLREWLNKLGSQGRIVPDNYKIRYAGIPIKPVARTCADRLLVAGDAAGQVKPTTGGGIYFGLLCADLAVKTLCVGLQSGEYSAVKFSVYEKEWRKLIGRELKNEYFARRLYQQLSDKQINAIFARAKSSGIVESIMKESISFDWHGDLLLRVLKAAVVSRVNRIFRLPIMKG